MAGKYREWLRTLVRGRRSSCKGKTNLNHARAHTHKQAFTTMLEKTFETMPFDDFKAFSGQEFGETHRDYLFVRCVCVCACVLCIHEFGENHRD